jgi:hypothetical protein
MNFVNSFIGLLVYFLKLDYFVKNHLIAANFYTFLPSYGTN